MASVKNISQWVIDMILFNHILMLNNKIIKLNKNYELKKSQLNGGIRAGYPLTD